MFPPASRIASFIPGGAPRLPDRLTFGDREVQLRHHERPQARRLSLRICAATRSIILTSPPGLSTRATLSFLERHRGWLEREIERQLQDPVPFRPGTILPVADQPLLLAEGAGFRAERQGGTLFVPGAGDRFRGRVRRFLEKEARALLAAESRAMAAAIGREVESVGVGDFRSRWGSCNAEGRIAYSWRLLLAPGFVRRAVVAHEVAHLVELNHGPRFWALATRLLGEPHDRARRWLRDNRALLMRYGASASL